MIILKESKNSDPLCPHCIYKDECKKEEYDKIACCMSRSTVDSFSKDFLKETNK